MGLNYLTKSQIIICDLFDDSFRGYLNAVLCADLARHFCTIFVIRLDFRCTISLCTLISSMFVDIVVSLLLRPFILNLLMDLCLASYFQFLNLYPPQWCYLEVAAALLAFWSPIKVIKLCHSFWYKMLLNLVARYDNACTTYFHLSFSWLIFFRLILNCLYNIVSSSHIVLEHLQHS